jgi:rhomboid protease GluP
MYNLPKISSAQKYKVTFVLIALNVAMYIYTSVIGGDALITNYYVVYQYGQVNGLIMYGGVQFYYQMFTSMFVHVNIVHLAGNMCSCSFLVCAGKKCFRCLNTWQSISLAA